MRTNCTLKTVSQRQRTDQFTRTALFAAETNRKLIPMTEAVNLAPQETWYPNCSFVRNCVSTDCEQIEVEARLEIYYHRQIDAICKLKCLQLAESDFVRTIRCNCRT